MSFQQTLGDAHQSFLRASEVAFSQLGGTPVSAEMQAPLTAQVAAPVARPGVEVPAVAQTSVQAQAVEPAFETLDFERMLLDIVAEKTGYPQEMLTLDMELESGLGIDSIKRVEILSTLQEEMPHLGELDTAELAELNTLGEIIEFAAASGPTVPSTTTPAANPVIGRANTTDLDFESMLLDVVAEKTGYPKEMLTLDMELESGLGIDSIKRVEILSTLQEQLPSLGEMDTAELAELNTLGEIIELASASAGPVSSAPVEVTATSTATSTVTTQDFESMLLDVVAEKTGYPKEMLTLDMELESGLGIDSINRVEILSS